MGLDMYLTKKVWVGGQYEHCNVTGRVSISLAGVKLPIPLKQVQEIILAVGYWRKANQIHQWFVDNVQGGADNCDSYYVSTDKLKELLAICQTVKLDPERGARLLPTVSGFFFGSTEYDEYYMWDIKNTIKIIQDTLKTHESLEGQYYYQSSW